MAILKIKNKNTKEWEDIITIKGDKGDKPTHEIDGTRIRFQNPDGTWGDWIELEVLTAEQVPTNDGSNVQEKIENSFNLGSDENGNLYKQNDFGLILLHEVDLNKVKSTGMYHASSSCTNIPYQGQNNYLVVEAYSDNYVQQTLSVRKGTTTTNNIPVFKRQYTSGVWTNWILIAGELNVWTGSVDTGTLNGAFNLSMFGAVKILIASGSAYAHGVVNKDNNNVRASCTDVANSSGALNEWGVVLSFKTTDNVITIARSHLRSESTTSMSASAATITKIVGLP